MQEAEAKRCDEAGEYLRAIHGYDAWRDRDIQVASRPVESEGSAMGWDAQRARQAGMTGRWARGTP